MFNRLIVCLDMVGCPNRCKHCWIGVHSNGNLKINDLIYVYDEFKKVTKEIEVDSWYREPDYHKDYQKLYKLERELSDFHHEHFELISFYRAVRDKDYIPWLKTIGVKTVQLTFFGLEKNTDYYVGRVGAFRELLETIELLLENKIAPRVQIFVYKDNIDELKELVALFDKMNLDHRCQEIGQEFTLFIHQGSPDGESTKLVNNWITEEELSKIPVYLKEKTFKHLRTDSYIDVFGVSEKELYIKYMVKTPDLKLVSSTPVFYIDKDFNVYPNYCDTNKYWCLGNLKGLGVGEIIDNYVNNRSPAQNAFLTIPFKDMLKEFGNPNGEILFSDTDYIFHILQRYLKANK